MPPTTGQPRKGDLILWEQNVASASLDEGTTVVYRVGTVAHVRRDGQVMALADGHNGHVAWRAAWKPSSRPPIIRWWVWSATTMNVAAALAAYRDHRYNDGPLGCRLSYEQLCAMLKPFEAQAHTAAAIRRRPRNAARSVAAANAQYAAATS